jgi:hypothetical protein
LAVTSFLKADKSSLATTFQQTAACIFIAKRALGITSFNLEQTFHQT